MTISAKMFFIVILSIAITLCIIAIGYFNDDKTLSGILPRVVLSILACMFSSFITGIILSII